MIFQGFRLLMEYHSFLLIKCSNQLMVIISFRLLTELYSFLLKIKQGVMTNVKSSFRLLTELYSFLLEYHMTMKDTMNEEFPSPYGVSFILIKWSCRSIRPNTWKVSVSLWSYIHSYVKMKSINVTTGMFPSPYGVIFILI